MNNRSVHEQQDRHEQQGPCENEQQQNHDSVHEQQVHHEYDREQQQLQVQEHEGHDGNEQQQQDHNDNVQEPHDEVAQALNEVEAIIEEMEQAGIPLNPLFEDDEGIALDLYEEIHGDIEDFDYRSEVELEGYM